MSKPKSKAQQSLEGRYADFLNMKAMFEMNEFKAAVAIRNEANHHDYWLGIERKNYDEVSVMLDEVEPNDFNAFKLQRRAETIYEAMRDHAWKRDLAASFFDEIRSPNSKPFVPVNKFDG
jgi:hypothetical protein